MTDTIEIKELSRERLGEIEPLWAKLNAHHRERSTHFVEHFSTFTFGRRQQDWLRQNEVIAFVGEVAGEFVGYCVAAVSGDVGEVESLFIDQPYRGRGLGEALMRNALEWLMPRAATIRVAVAEGNEAALGFYRRFGFAERLTVMQLKR